MHKQRIYMVAALIFLLSLSLICLSGCKQKDQPQPQQTDSAPKKPAGYVPPAEVPAMTLDQIIASANTWSPAFQDLIGKDAPDFELKGLNGQNYKLSDSKGKNVLLVFWATWCGPCKHEVPSLIALRKLMSKDDLEIFAITNENFQSVKNFVVNMKINYKILLNPQNSLPAPYDSIRSIPTAFFIDPAGKIKFATVGSLDLATLKAIIRAK